MTVHDAADELEKNLPLFLTQQWQGALEVIVVDDASTDETADVLKRMRAQYHNLYSTFVPKSVPDPCRHRLTLNVGVKAAHYEWIVVADIARPPRTDMAFERLAEVIALGGIEAVTVYGSNKEGKAPRYHTWTELTEAAPLLRKAERRPGRRHRGRWFRSWRGMYDAVAVPKELITDTLRYFDHDIHGWKLAGLRLCVFSKCLFHHSS